MYDCVQPDGSCLPAVRLTSHGVNHASSITNDKHMVSVCIILASQAKRCCNTTISVTEELSASNWLIYGYEVGEWLAEDEIDSLGQLKVIREN